MRIFHDIALLNLTILLEQTADFLLREARVDARHEEVRARVAAVVIVTAARVWGRAAVFRQ